jgi:hypothetical protein
MSQSFVLLFALGLVLPACGAPGAAPASRSTSRPVADLATAAPGEPTIFAPGVISGPADDLCPAFTPDTTTVYFARERTILVSHRVGESWSEPEIAPFSGVWGDSAPAMAPDGSFLLFVSNRPASAGGAALDGEWGYPTRLQFAGRGGNLWRVDRRGDSWSDPVRLPDAINRGSAVFEPWIVADGSLYFMDAHLPGRFRLYRSQYAAGVYQDPVPLPFGDGTWSDVDTTVAPDESFLVLASTRPPVAPDTQTHGLFIAFRRGDTWGDLVYLGAAISPVGADQIQPRLGPDHRMLYFGSDRTIKPVFPRTREAARRDLEREHAWDNGRLNIWRVDLTPWLPPPSAAR